MKNRVLFIVLLISLAVCIFLVSGCASMSALMKSNISGLPYWYYNPQMGTGSGNTGIVGVGTAATQRQARLLACSDLVLGLSEMVGYDLGQEAYREISVMGTLSTFGLVIINESSSTEDGQFVHYLHAAINKSLLDAATTEERKRKSELAQDITSLVLEGDEFVKAGKELRAVKNYMKAMALSYGFSDISAEYSFDSLEVVVSDLLNGISMSIISSRPAVASCTVALSRKGVFVSSAVSSAEILASYDAVDTRGDTYRDRFVYVTDSNGQFSFNSINDSISRSGKVTFTLDLEKELSDLESVAGVERIERLRSLVSSKTISFDYSKVFSLGPIAVTVVEHDAFGNVTGNTVTTEYLVSKFRSDGAQSRIFYSTFDDEDDILFEFQKSGSIEKCLLVVRVGMTGSLQSSGGLHCVNAEGLVTLFDADTSEILYQSDVMYSSAFSELYEEAVAGAFRKLSDLAYMLVKAVYV